MGGNVQPLGHEKSHRRKQMPRAKQLAKPPHHCLSLPRGRTQQELLALCAGQGLRQLQQHCLGRGVQQCEVQGVLAEWTKPSIVRGPPDSRSVTHDKLTQTKSLAIQIVALPAIAPSQQCK